MEHPDALTPTQPVSGLLQKDFRSQTWSGSCEHHSLLTLLPGQESCCLTAAAAQPCCHGSSCTTGVHKRDVHLKPHRVLPSQAQSSVFGRSTVNCARGCNHFSGLTAGLSITKVFSNLILWSKANRFKEPPPHLFSAVCTGNIFLHLFQTLLYSSGTLRIHLLKSNSKINRFFDCLEIIQSSPTDYFTSSVRPGFTAQKDHRTSLLPPEETARHVSQTTE